VCAAVALSGWAWRGVKADPHSEPGRAATAGVGATTGVLEKELRRLENHGRALRIEHEHETLSAGWAGPRKWKHIGPQCNEFVRAQLEPLVKQIRATKAQLDRLTQEIEALVEQEKIPVGPGALTVALIDGEVCNWKRFLHRKAVGSYTGICTGPSKIIAPVLQRLARERARTSTRIST
jgi:transposase